MTTPMMAQWQECKALAVDALLLFRLGDFYEAFHDDALTLSKELDLVLTKRQEIPMAGLPVHLGDQYIDRLVAKGYKVAVAEQLEPPKPGAGLVKRSIVRTVTPGTVINSDLLQDKTHNYIACLTQVNKTFGLAYSDITTAAFGACEFTESKALFDELLRLSPKELILSKKSEWVKEIRELFTPSFNFKEAWAFDHANSLKTLQTHFNVASLDGFGLKGKTAAINAAGALLAHLKEELHLPTQQIAALLWHEPSHYMALDATTQKNLELTASLFPFLDRTQTPMGARLLKDWLLHPLLDLVAIHKRQEALQRLLTMEPLPLGAIRDLERLIMRIETGFASPRDLAALRLSLEPIPYVATRLEKTPLASPALFGAEEIAQILAEALVESPPFRFSDGPIFKSGFHPELDELRALKENSHAWVAKYQKELREETGIKSLKVGYTRAFGYYIETSRGASEKVPAHFQRKQTLVNNERYITAALKEFEAKILNAEERILSLEQDLFHTLRKKIAAFAPKVRAMASAIAEIDSFCALADVAKKHRFVCPIVDGSDRFEVEEGRHPILEAALPQEQFIPNSLLLGGENPQLILITGPNMAGKSTYLRQSALIAILAQMGSFVPAKSAHIGLIDKVFCRIGANDDLARGQSTFMVEMVETANILNNATERSLVILDEIGRGTTTYDGISIAWAVAEYLLTEPHKKAKTLFATHYWELTELAKQFSKAANFHVAVQEENRQIVFLRKILPGSAKKSYGIHVARLAGLPTRVLERAEKQLAALEKKGGRKPLQLSLFHEP